MRELADARERAPRRSGDFAAADRLRDEIASHGVGDPGRARWLDPFAALILYGRNPVREALRGRRAHSITELWATPGRGRVSRGCEGLFP